MVRTERPPLPPSLSHQDKKNELKEAFEALKEAGFDEARKEAVAAFYEELHTELAERGLALSDFQSLQSKMLNTGALIRRDDPDRVLSLLFDQQPIELTPRNPGEANVATGDREGLHVAITEGFGGKDLVTFYSFRPDLEETQVNRVDQGSTDLRGPERFVHIRSVQGKIEPEDLEFVVFRFPSEGFPEDRLTEEEEDLVDDGKLPYIYRGVDVRGQLSA